MLSCDQIQKQGLVFFVYYGSRMDGATIDSDSYVGYFVFDLDLLVLVAEGDD